MTVTDQATVTEKPANSAWGRAAVWLAVIGGLAVAFAQNFAEMWIRWFPAWHRESIGLYERFVRGESYYTHGPLVPLVSLLIVFLLIRFTKVPVRPRPALGFTVLAFSLLLHLASCLARVNFASAFALIGVLAGIVLILWGTTALRRFWFPLAFLFFMVPLPEVSIASLNFRLKMVAADWGVRLANLTGIIAERAGNRVFLEGEKSLVIANVCNGLRTLITVIGFGALYAYVCRLPRGWRLVLFAMSVPVALVANSIRIVGLIVVAHFWDEKAATGWFHDTSGAFIFVLAFLMMFGIERLILWGRGLLGKHDVVDQLFKDVRRDPQDPQDERQASHLCHAAASPRGWMMVAALAIGAFGALWLNRSVPPTWNQAIAAQALPEVLTVSGREWRSRDYELDEATLTMLETTDYLCRRYFRNDAPFVEFSIVFSKDNRKGTHPPDLCLQGSGDGIVAKGSVLVTAVEGRGDITCSELIVQSGNNKVCFVYFYKCGNIYTPSFWTQQFVILWNGLTHRDASGALIRLSTAIVNDDTKDARERIAEFVRVAVPYLDKGLQ